jgi:hypothetical protein
MLSQHSPFPQNLESVDSRSIVINIKVDNELWDLVYVGEGATVSETKLLPATITCLEVTLFRNVDALSC